MKKTLVILAIALLGIGMLTYPLVAQYISNKNGSYVANNYEKLIDDTDEKEIEEAWNEAVKYNENLSGNPVHDPFLEGSGMVMQDNYYDVLAISETMGYITIPKIDVKLPIYHGTSQDVLEKGVGHLEGSSMPVGGEGTHCVLTGHTGMQNAKLFTDLTELEEGDTFYLHILGRVLAYQVDRITVVEPNELDDLKRVDGEDYCTLVTCTPYGVNSHRLLVRGKRIKYTEKEQAQEDAASKHTLTTQEKMTIIAAAVTTAIMLVLIGITLVVVRRRNKNI